MAIGHATEALSATARSWPSGIHILQIKLPVSKFAKYRSHPERCTKVPTVSIRKINAPVNWPMCEFVNPLVQTPKQIKRVYALRFSKNRFDKGGKQNSTPRYLSGVYLKTPILAFATKRSFPRYRFYNVTPLLKLKSAVS